MPPTVEKFVLKNGVRVLCESVSHVQSVAIGVWCQTGSRMEAKSEAGISHLIEHMLFKGTHKRSAKQIAESIEGRGGHLNAFTDREATCFYARVLRDDVQNAAEVISDMLLNSRLAKEDLEVEKRVVQEEIRKYLDSPEEHIHDLHAQHRWKGHPLGKPIIGSHESVGGFTSENLADYMRRRYVPNRILIAAAGNLDSNTLRDQVENLYQNCSGQVPLPSDPLPNGGAGISKISKDVEQVHFCIGCGLVNLYSDARYPAIVMDALLGGSMSSRLFQEIREKRGLVYAIGSYLSLYREAGAFTVYGGTNPENFDEVCELTRAELKKVRETPIADEELERTKRMLSGEMVLGLEGMSARMTRMARNEMIYEREIPVEEALNKTRSVTAKQIQDLANEYITDDKLAITAIGPF